MESTSNTATQAPAASNHLQPAAPPVFIVGPSRSGTTLLARMLDAHSALAIFPETGMFSSLDRLGCVDRFQNRWQYIAFMNEFWESVEDYPDVAAAVLAGEAMRQPSYVGPTKPVLEAIGRSYTRIRSARIWGEKTPGHALWLSEIRYLFPNAKLIFAIRDPRDVLVSYCERWNRGRSDATYVMASAAIVRYHLNHLLNFSQFPPEQVHWIRYESITAEPVIELKRVCEFLGIAFEPDMLLFYLHHQNVERETPNGVHHKLLSQPVSTERVGRFRQAFQPPILALVEEFLRDEMERLGYPREGNAKTTLTPMQLKARRRAIRLYEEMLLGRPRRHYQRRGRLAVLLYRTFGKALAAMAFTHLAVTAEDWQRRLQMATSRNTS